jgi:hypothetical protein
VYLKYDSSALTYTGYSCEETEVAFYIQNPASTGWLNYCVVKDYELPIALSSLEFNVTFQVSSEASGEYVIGYGDGLDSPPWGPSTCYDIEWGGLPATYNNGSITVTAATTYSIMVDSTISENSKCSA